MKVSVHVKANKKQNSVVERHGEYMMTINGDGNEEQVVALLADHLHISQSLIKVLENNQSRMMILNILDTYE